LPSPISKNFSKTFLFEPPSFFHKLIVLKFFQKKSIARKKFEIFSPEVKKIGILFSQNFLKQQCHTLVPSPFPDSLRRRFLVCFNKSDLAWLYYYFFFGKVPSPAWEKKVKLLKKEGDCFKNPLRIWVLRTPKLSQELFVFRPLLGLARKFFYWHFEVLSRINMPT